MKLLTEFALSADVKLIMSDNQMTYTIKGKQYSEFDINKRCAELSSDLLYAGDSGVYLKSTGSKYNPCNNPSDTWPIIEKCSDDLMSLVNKHGETPKSKEGILWTRWQHLEELHNCNKLVAACICMIEMAGDE